MNGLKKVVFPEVERANRDLSSGGGCSGLAAGFASPGVPRIMEQELGPIRHQPPGPGSALADNAIIVKLVPSMSSAEQDFMVEVIDVQSVLPPCVR